MRYFVMLLFLVLAPQAQAQTQGQGVVCPQVQCPPGQERDRATCLCKPVVCTLVCISPKRPDTQNCKCVD